MKKSSPLLTENSSLFYSKNSKNAETINFKNSNMNHNDDININQSSPDFIRKQLLAQRNTNVEPTSYSDVPQNFLVGDCKIRRMGLFPKHKKMRERLFILWEHCKAPYDQSKLEYYEISSTKKRNWIQASPLFKALYEHSRKHHYTDSSDQHHKSSGSLIPNSSSMTLNDTSDSNAIEKSHTFSHNGGMMNIPRIKRTFSHRLMAKKSDVKPLPGSHTIADPQHGLDFICEDNFVNKDHHNPDGISKPLSQLNINLVSVPLNIGENRDLASQYMSFYQQNINHSKLKPKRTIFLRDCFNIGPAQMNAEHPYSLAHWANKNFGYTVPNGPNITTKQNNAPFNTNKHLFSDEDEYYDEGQMNASSKRESLPDIIGQYIEKGFSHAVVSNKHIVLGSHSHAHKKYYLHHRNTLGFGPQQQTSVIPQAISLWGQDPYNCVTFETHSATEMETWLDDLYVLHQLARMQFITFPLCAAFEWVWLVNVRSRGIANEYRLTGSYYLALNLRDNLFGLFKYHQYYDEERDLEEDEIQHYYALTSTTTTIPKGGKNMDSETGSKINKNSPKAVCEKTTNPTITSLSENTGSTTSSASKHLLPFYNLISRMDVQIAYIEFCSIKRCGYSKDYFYVEFGRTASLGTGELWMRTQHEYQAALIHTIILKRMRHKSTQKDDSFFLPSYPTGLTSSPTSMPPESRENSTLSTNLDSNATVNTISSNGSGSTLTCTLNPNKPNTSVSNNASAESNLVTTVSPRQIKSHRIEKIDLKPVLTPCSNDTSSAMGSIQPQNVTSINRFAKTNAHNTGMRQPLKTFILNRFKSLTTLNNTKGINISNKFLQLPKQKMTASTITTSMSENQIKTTTLPNKTNLSINAPKTSTGTFTAAATSDSSGSGTLTYLPFKFSTAIKTNNKSKNKMTNFATPVVSSSGDDNSGGLEMFGFKSVTSKDTTQTITSLNNNQRIRNENTTVSGYVSMQPLQNGELQQNQNISQEIYNRSITPPIIIYKSEDAPSNDISITTDIQTNVNTTTNDTKQNQLQTQTTLEHSLAPDLHDEESILAIPHSYAFSPSSLSSSLQFHDRLDSNASSILSTYSATNSDFSSIHGAPTSKLPYTQERAMSPLVPSDRKEIKFYINHDQGIDGEKKSSFLSLTDRLEVLKAHYMAMSVPSGGHIGKKSDFSSQDSGYLDMSTKPNIDVKTHRTKPFSEEVSLTAPNEVSIDPLSNQKAHGKTLSRPNTLFQTTGKKVSGYHNKNSSSLNEIAQRMDKVVSGFFFAAATDAKKYDYKNNAAILSPNTNKGVVTMSLTPDSNFLSKKLSGTFHKGHDESMTQFQERAASFSNHNEYGSSMLGTPKNKRLAPVSRASKPTRATYNYSSPLILHLNQIDHQLLMENERLLNKRSPSDVDLQEIVETFSDAFFLPITASGNSGQDLVCSDSTPRDSASPNNIISLDRISDLKSRLAARRNKNGVSFLETEKTFTNFSVESHKSAYKTPTTNEKILSLTKSPKASRPDNLKGLISAKNCTPPPLPPLPLAFPVPYFAGKKNQRTQPLDRNDTITTDHMMVGLDDDNFIPRPPSSPLSFSSTSVGSTHWSTSSITSNTTTGSSRTGLAIIPENTDCPFYVQDSIHPNSFNNHNSVHSVASVPTFLDDENGGKIRETPQFHHLTHMNIDHSRHTKGYNNPISGGPNNDKYHNKNINNTPPLSGKPAQAKYQLTEVNHNGNADDDDRIRAYSVGSRPHPPFHFLKRRSKGAQKIKQSPPPSSLVSAQTLITKTPFNAENMPNPRMPIIENLEQKLQPHNMYNNT